MPFHSAGLTRAGEEDGGEAGGRLPAISKTFTGGRAIPKGLTLYQSLAGSKNPKDQELRHYLWINGSRFDLIDDNNPFVGDDTHAAGTRFLSEGPDRAIRSSST